MINLRKKKIFLKKRKYYPEEIFYLLKEETNYSLSIIELQYSNYILEKNTFMINPNYNKKNYSHKGVLNFNRNIRIVNRDQLN